jgi:hypothetical protein
MITVSRSILPTVNSVRPNAVPNIPRQQARHNWHSQDRYKISPEWDYLTNGLGNNKLNNYRLAPVGSCF